MLSWYWMLTILTTSVASLLNINFNLHEGTVWPKTGTDFLISFLRIMTRQNQLWTNGHMEDFSANTKTKSAQIKHVSTHRVRFSPSLVVVGPVQSRSVRFQISHWGPGSGSSGSCLQSRAPPGWWCCGNQIWCGAVQWPRAARTGDRRPLLTINEKQNKRMSHKQRMFVAPS